MRRDYKVGIFGILIGFLIGFISGMHYLALLIQKQLASLLNLPADRISWLVDKFLLIR